MKPFIMVPTCRLRLLSILLIISSIFFSLSSEGQSISKHVADLKLQILEKKDNAPIPYATVILKAPDGKTHGAIADDEGFSYLRNIPIGRYRLTISAIGYQTLNQQITIPSEKVIYRLQESTTELKDVIVTAKETPGVRTTSIIDREAMQVLQPSSISDILELLPGGRFVDPDFSGQQTITLRQAQSMGDSYSTGSLGTAFMIDGVQLPVNGNGITLPHANTVGEMYRTKPLTGVDMRTVGSDDIEQVKITRGVPSVEYGDLTDGLVEISRKRGERPYEGRFKADLSSMLFYLGKGWAYGQNNGHEINISTNFLNSLGDPRDPTDTYRRAGVSIRGAHNLLDKSVQGKRELVWSIDYTGSFDRVKVDPEVDISETDRFYKGLQQFTTSLQYNRIWANQKGCWHPTSWRNLISLNVTDDHLERDKMHYINFIIPLTPVIKEGEQEGIYIDQSYRSHLDILSKPLTFRTKSVLEGSISSFVDQRYKAGVELSVDKNLGVGERYDPTKPPYPNSGLSDIPVKLNDYPAMIQSAAFIEDNIRWNISRHEFNLVGGLRLSNLYSDKSYQLSKKINIDPRINLLWELPEALLQGNHPLKVSFGVSWGLQTKYPALLQLFPRLDAEQFHSLNYYHSNPEYRSLIITSFITDPSNKELQAARNEKLEARINLFYHSHHLTATWFREELNNGFRSIGTFRAYRYNEYDYSGLDHDKLTEKPNYTTLPYTERAVLRSARTYGNGSSTIKNGVELNYRSPRVRELLNTRVTFTGAYFNTRFSNSIPLYEKPSIVLNGQEYPYIGKYAFRDGYTAENVTTNLTIDSYLAPLKLNLVLIIQNLWFQKLRIDRFSQRPISYMDTAEVEHPFDDTAAEDPILSMMIKERADDSALTNVYPREANINFKANKQIGEHLRISLYVNRLFSINQKMVYENYYEQKYRSPYFGMEMNLTF